jgi:hypothetical protein
LTSRACGEIGRPLASDAPLTGEQIAALVAEVADALPTDGHRQTVIIAGGSLLAWRGLRETTVDVDSVQRLSTALRTAVAEVAARHDLAPRWLNDNAAMFRPQTLSESNCGVLLDHPRLLVLGASYRDVFLMKLFAARAADHDDLVRLWPLAGFTSPEAAAAEMYAAFPAAPDDPQLSDYVAGIAGESADN